MKKILLLFLIVVSLGKLYAQDGGGIVLGKLYFGGKFGYGTVDFESTDPAEKDFAQRTFLNISYGAVAGYRVNATFSVQVEALYAQYSANKIKYEYLYRSDNPLLISYSGNSTIDHVDMDLYSMDIPITARYHFSSGDIAPYAYVGVNWGINVTGYTTITRAINDPYAGIIYREFNDGITQQIRYNEFAPIFGGGVNIDLGSKFTVFGDARYKYGVMNSSNVQNNLGFKSSALWLSAGLVFNL